MADADPPRRRTQAERSETMQARLIAAASDNVRDRGFARLRMADVAATAGVSIGALLHHFPTRNALIVALFEHLYRLMAEASGTRRGGIVTLHQAVRALIVDAREFFLGDSFAASLDIAIGAARDDTLREDVLAIIARYRVAVETLWVDQLTALGIAQESAVDAVWIANSLFRGLAVRAIWDDDRARFTRMEEICERVLLRDLSAA